MTYLERAYPWLLASPVILPLVIWGGLIYPYLVPKTLLFYALSLITLAVFLVLAAYGRSFYWDRLRQKEAWVPVALLVLAYVASAFGLDFYRSFWSIFVRGDGLLMLTCAVADFYLILLYANRSFFESVTRAIATVASIVAVYGIGEWLLAGGRIGSLLGNAAFFAGYLAIAFFATLISAESLKSQWRTAAYCGAGLQLIAIILSATRGSILALASAGVVTLIYFARKGRGSVKHWSLGILGAGIVVIGIFFVFRTELAQVPFQPIARIASIGTTDSDVSSRLFIWKNMIGEIGKAPLLGVGAEHVDVLFNRFYDPTQIDEQWFDRSHNAFLDYAAQYGIGGFILYVLLIGSFITAACRLLKKNTHSQSARLFVLLAITYAVQNFFVFDTISSFWLFLALLALLLSLSGEAAVLKKISLPAWSSYVAWPVAGVLLLLIIPASVRPAIAAYDLAQAYQYQLTDVAKETNYLSHGIALGTYGDLEYGYEAYDMYANDQATRLSGPARVDGYQVALSILTTNFNRYPYDARTALYLAHVLALAPSGVVVDQQLLSSALTRTTALSPKRSQPWYILINLALGEANQYPAGSPQRLAGYAKAEDLLTQYVALVPDLSETHFVFAELDRAMGDSVNADNEAALGKVDYRPDLETARRAAGYYENVKDWQDARFFLSEVVRLAPEDIVSLYDLAKVEYLSGDPAASEQIVAGLRRTNPDVLATDKNFLAAITAYESQH